MSGTKTGGLKAGATNKLRHGDDFYKRIGSIGGKRGTTGGFYADRELARRAGAIGGRISRRGKSKKSVGTVWDVTPPEKLFSRPCTICGADPMTANCNGANCDE